MGRPERPVDPGAGPVQRLAHELRELRRAAGSPSYRVMAESAGFSATTLSQAAAVSDETAPPYRGLARFEPDDHALFFGRDRLVEELRRLVCDHRFAVVFGASGTLAVGGEAGSLQLWDIATQQPLGGLLTTPGEEIDTVAFGADSGTLYAGSAHVPLQRYTIAPSRAVASVCAGGRRRSDAGAVADVRA